MGLNPWGWMGACWIELRGSKNVFVLHCNNWGQGQGQGQGQG